MKYYAGIDGGQSSTKAVVADESGTILGRGSVGPADEVGQYADSTRLRDAIEGSLTHALLAAQLRPDTHFEAVVAGITGYDGRTRGLDPRVNADRFSLLHDAPIAHAGALSGESGIIALAGTGSVIHAATGDGRSLTLGGWGYVFGDEGSAFWIGRNVLNAAMHDEDRAIVTPLLTGALEVFSVHTMREVQAALAGGTLSRDRIAAYAQNALAATDPRVEVILENGTTALAQLVAIAARRLDMGDGYRIALVGGLSAEDRYCRSFERSCRSIGISATMVKAQEDAVVGALRMAMR